MLRELSLTGVLLSEPTIHPDERGSFHEWFKASDFEEATGFPFDLQQANVSTSKRGVVRGLHFADVPPGQAKFVSCLSGAILDVIVDIREGSPTFAQHLSVELSAANRHSVFIPVGFAHGFLALHDATVAYLTTSEYDPSVEHAIDPFDTELGISWGQGEYLLSDKDSSAPSLVDARVNGLLPTFNDCKEYQLMLQESWKEAGEQEL